MGNATISGGGKYECYGDCTMSTLFVNNLNTASGTTITVPTGKKVGTDYQGLMDTPSGNMLLKLFNAHHLFGDITTSSQSTTDVVIIVTITPKYSSSKIYVMGVQIPMYTMSGSNVIIWFRFN